MLFSAIGPCVSSTQFTATIRWHTALPVREALLRQAGGSRTDEAQTAASLTALVPSGSLESATIKKSSSSPATAPPGSAT